MDDEFPGSELNIEGYPDSKFIALVEANKPEQVTLVPDGPDQKTSDHGWNFQSNFQMLKQIIERLKKIGCRISLFCDPDSEQLELAKAIGADRIELYTGLYGICHDNSAEAIVQLRLLARTANLAKMLDLGVNAGHDLTVDNLPALIHHIPHLAEVSIGHAITAQALQYGMAESVRLFFKACGSD